MHKHPFASVPFTTVCKRLSNARIPDVGTIGCGAGSRRGSSGAACGNLANDTLQNSANAIASTPAHPRRNVVIHTRWPRERAGWTRAGCVASGPCEQSATKLNQRFETTVCQAVHTGKKTPGGAGTHTGHTGHADAQRHTDHTDRTNLTTIQTHQQHTPRTSARRPKPRPTQQPVSRRPGADRSREQRERPLPARPTQKRPPPHTGNGTVSQVNSTCYTLYVVINEVRSQFKWPVIRFKALADHVADREDTRTSVHVAND